MEAECKRLFEEIRTALGDLKTGMGKIERRLGGLEKTTREGFEAVRSDIGEIRAELAPTTQRKLKTTGGQVDDGVRPVHKMAAKPHR